MMRRSVDRTAQAARPAPTSSAKPRRGSAPLVALLGAGLLACGCNADNTTIRTGSMVEFTVETIPSQRGQPRSTGQTRSSGIVMGRPR